MQYLVGYVCYNTVKKIKEYSGYNAYDLTKFNKLFEDKHKQIVDNILIYNIYKYRYNVFLYNDKFEKYNNIQYKLTDDDKKQLLKFKSYAYERLNNDNSIINDFIGSDKSDDKIIDDYKLMLSELNSLEMRDVLHKYEFRDYIVDILHTNIYEFVYDRYQNADKAEKTRINDTLFSGTSPDYKKIIWLHEVICKDLYKQYCTADSQKKKEEIDNFVKNNYQKYNAYEYIWKPMVENKGYLPPSINNFLYKNNIYDDTIVISSYFTNCDEIFNSFIQLTNNDYIKNNIDFFIHSILFGFITNPKIIGYLKPFVK